MAGRLSDQPAMDHPVQVRRADISRLDEAARLFDGYLHFYEKAVDAAASRRFIGERLQRQDSVILLAAAGGRDCGFMQLYPSFASLSLAPSWILNDLFVEAQGRGHGVGEALMAAALGLAAESGAAEIFLQTARDNSKAQRLYERLGYRRDDEFLVYTLALPGS